MIDVEIWRVEDRYNPDGVDFWDFSTEEKANKWINHYPDEIHRYNKPRKISQDELEILATQLIRDYLKDYLLEP